MDKRENYAQKNIESELGSFLEGFEPSEYVGKDWQNADGMYQQYSAFSENMPCPMGSLSLL